jgi:hypothetical protein
MLRLVRAARTRGEATPRHPALRSDPLALLPEAKYTELMISNAEDSGLATAPGGDKTSDDGDGPVNFDEAALVEVEIDGTDYRLDSGRAGTALCISTRASGTWSWTFRGEARWQANVLRCKAFDRSVLVPLGKALAEAAAATD